MLSKETEFPYIRCTLSLTYLIENLNLLALIEVAGDGIVKAGK